MVDSGVMICFVEVIFDGLVFKSGGGIIVCSWMEVEYGELF